MSVVIVGGNECMTRQYIDLCRQYKFKVKVYCKAAAGLKDIGSPDLLVLFTDTVSHVLTSSTSHIFSESTTSPLLSSRASCPVLVLISTKSDKAF